MNEDYDDRALRFIVSVKETASIIRAFGVAGDFAFKLCDTVARSDHEYQSRLEGSR